MLCASLLLLAGCKHKSGLEILSGQMTGMKALKSQYVIQRKGQKDLVVDFLFSKPNRILATSPDFAVACNEIDGHFESPFASLAYDSLPWDGKLYPGTGKLVSPSYVSAGPVSSESPNAIAPEVPWKLESKSGSIERYTKTVQSLRGPQVFKLEVDDQGKPVKFQSPEGIIYVTRSFEMVGEIPIEQFRVEPRDGFVCSRINLDQMTLQAGEKFGWSQYKAAPDVSNFTIGGNTLFAIIDPTEASSHNTETWLKTVNAKYKKVTISKGKANSGFFDPKGDEIRKLTTSTPTFVLVDKDSKIIGLWLGFDTENIKEFEADILKAIG